MTTATYESRSWLGRAEDWLDSRGKGAWIAVMVLGFIFFWPVGLALLAYMIWSKRMFNSSGCAGRRGRHHRATSLSAPSGNSAFDAYREETLRRLEDEQTAFEAFLQRLREAKDKQEFDAFMQDRARAARDTAAGSDRTETGREPPVTGSGAY